MTQPTPPTKAALELMVQLVQENYNQFTSVTNQLLASYQSDAYKYRAQLQVIREELEELFARGVMPTPDAIMWVVNYPDAEKVDNLIQAFHGGQF